MKGNLMSNIALKIDCLRYIANFYLRSVMIRIILKFNRSSCIRDISLEPWRGRQHCCHPHVRETSRIISLLVTSPWPMKLTVLFWRDNNNSWHSQKCWLHGFYACTVRHRLLDNIIWTFVINVNTCIAIQNIAWQ
jgi:hypothetical protein